MTHDRCNGEISVTWISSAETEAGIDCVGIVTCLCVERYRLRVVVPWHYVWTQYGQKVATEIADAYLEDPNPGNVWVTPWT